MIEIKNITKEYNGKKVLDIASLGFRADKIYALMGANGSGKSTLIRIMAGTLLPDSGVVSGADKGTIGYMPQSAYAFGFSVQKNVEMALGRDKNKKQRAREALSLVGMLELSEKRGNTLSGGESQRMALARMLAIKRHILLLDEPTSAADIAGIDMIENALISYKRKHGCTMVFSTHAPAQALRLADYTVFLDKGHIAEIGETENVLHNPVSDAARLFLQHWRI